MNNSIKLGTTRLAALLVCTLSTQVQATLVTNGGFESGLSGWTSSDQIGSNGTFWAQSGSLSPMNGFSVPVPPQGSMAAMTDSAAGGSHVLYQDFLVPDVVTSASAAFSLYLNNAAGLFFNPGSLDWALTNSAGATNLNQQSRVDIMTTSANVFSVSPGDVLQNLFQTIAATPPISGYDPFLIDITALLQAHQGETLRLRFAETDNVNFFNFGVDDVSLTAIPGPSVWLLGLGALAGSPRRRRPGRCRENAPYVCVTPQE